MLKAFVVLKRFPDHDSPSKLCTATKLLVDGGPNPVPVSSTYSGAKTTVPRPLQMKLRTPHRFAEVSSLVPMLNSMAVFATSSIPAMEDAGAFLAEAVLTAAA